MEILEAFDATRGAHSAAALAGVEPASRRHCLPSGRSSLPEAPGLQLVGIPQHPALRRLLSPLAIVNAFREPDAQRASGHRPRRGAYPRCSSTTGEVKSSKKFALNRRGSAELSRAKTSTALAGRPARTEPCFPPRGQVTRADRDWALGWCRFTPAVEQCCEVTESRDGGPMRERPERAARVAAGRSGSLGRLSKIGWGHAIARSEGELCRSTSTSSSGMS